MYILCINAAAVAAYDDMSHRYLCFAQAKEGATKWIKRALALQPEDPKVLLKAGEIFRYHQNSLASKNHLEKSIKLQEDSKAYHKLGLTYKAMATMDTWGKLHTKRAGRKIQQRREGRRKGKLLADEERKAQRGQAASAQGASPHVGQEVKQEQENPQSSGEEAASLDEAEQKPETETEQNSETDGDTGNAVERENTSESSSQAVDTEELKLEDKQESEQLCKVLAGEEAGIRVEEMERRGETEKLVKKEDDGLAAKREGQPEKKQSVPQEYAKVAPESGREKENRVAGRNHPFPGKQVQQTGATDRPGSGRDSNGRQLAHPPAPRARPLSARDTASQADTFTNKSHGSVRPRSGRDFRDFRSQPARNHRNGQLQAGRPWPSNNTDAPPVPFARPPSGKDTRKPPPKTPHKDAVVRIQKMVKSPNMRAKRLDPNDHNVQNAVKNFRTAEKFSCGENTRAPYDLAILYFQCRQMDKARETYERITNRESGVGCLEEITALEQIALIDRAKAATVNDENEKASLLENSRHFFYRALVRANEMYSTIDKVKDHFKTIFQSPNAYLEALKADVSSKDEKKVKIAEALNLMQEHESVFKLLNDVANAEHHADYYAQKIRAYVGIKKYDEAIACLDLLHKKKVDEYFKLLDDDLLGREYVMEVCVNAGEQALKEGQKARHFPAAFDAVFVTKQDHEAASDASTAGDPQAVNGANSFSAAGGEDKADDDSGTKRKVTEDDTETECKVTENDAETKCKVTKDDTETKCKVTKDDTETKCKVTEDDTETKCKVTESDTQTKVTADDEAECEVETATACSSVPEPVVDIFILEDDEDPDVRKRAQDLKRYGVAVMFSSYLFLGYSI
jgi:tetratricopeptide (TPR) repeat protein